MLNAHSLKKTVLTLLTVVAITGTALAQAAPVAAQAQVKPPSVYQSPVFYLLALIAFILLVFIIQLGRVLSTVATNYSRGDKSMWDRFGAVAIITTLSLFTGNDAFAQVAATPAVAKAQANTPVLDFLHQGFGLNAINALVVIILIEVFVVFYLVRMIKLFVVKEKALNPLEEKQVSTSVFWDKFNKSVAVESEAAVLTDHDYDGIRELDNALPPWWKYGFYFTIVWAFSYYIYFHVSGGPSSQQEYKAQMEEGAVQVAAYQARAKDLVTESTVTLLTATTDISAGASIFTQYCVVCHRPDAGGLVGPNLTDKFWLHGGDIKDLFTTIKYGVQGKGMKSWQQELSPMMMAQVASYIKSLKDTNPVNPKAPEGNEWIPPSAATDTVAKLANDTIVKAMDTLSVK